MVASGTYHQQFIKLSNHHKVMPDSVLRLSEIETANLVKLLSRYQLELETVENSDIPGSYWGDAEAGLIGKKVFARQDTPIHSILHETCHYICMDESRRASLDTNAEGDYDEENAVCYLQILLADDIPEMGQERIMKDMDRWGYTFRLGSAQNWFENDADDASLWLEQNRLIDQHRSSYRLRY